MDFNKINDQITVSSQITPEEVSILKEKGFKTLICNRPDMEVEGDFGSEAMEKAAKAAGLGFVYLPVTPGQFTEELIAETARVLSEEDGPFYAYCRSGTRSTTVWALAQAGRMDADEIISQAAGAGYDMQGLKPYLAG
ncbi:TIGR01244 family sulfur transferase [Celeribacter halophilus]|uniref:TIGR01244 family sulfur transferase n=1 Tax=Celeribacter halophilus TaxID=576117 RepID=UPI001C092FB3|nr:TIGR01244 family sulfur transferase [Celeribacter halophilus]MBU2888587.1 TIGR01244 family phosphatase [Celeribacter halophilus]MDO6509058.1 TIGR01244 family sulfur transferase [Celeribacter halophilus]